MIKKPFFRQSKKTYLIFTVIGFVLMATGFIAEWYFKSDSHILGFCAGAGSALTALGAVGFILIKRKPVDPRQQSINENDERNIKIREVSAYGTYFVTLFALVAAIVVFLVLDYNVPCYITIGVMYIHVISYFFFLHRNSKKY